MSPLAARPGRNAARQAKKLKEIRHVKSAIRWAERARKQRKEISADRFEAKQVVVGRVKWEADNVHRVRREALRNAAEDWKMGPLRPNRAIGAGKDKYGALNVQQVQKPQIPTKFVRQRNELREKRGQELQYPLVVDDEKYFPIVAGDRVTIIKGRDAGRIGKVREVLPRTHEVVVEGLNKHYFDSNVFNRSNQDLPPKRESEAPIPLANLRLVVPYATTSYSSEGAQALTSAQDVVVDKIFMERHTTGIDPFTGTDYGDAEIPAKHQYDPQTGLPIFHRYIAGTRHRIEWPWETEKTARNGNKTPKEKTERQTWLGKTLSTLRHPITTLQRMTGTSTKSGAPRSVEPESDEPLLTQLETIEAKRQQKLRTKPRSKAEKTDAYEVDTTRNIVEGAESMSYTLVAPPFPETLAAELRGDIHDFAIAARKDKDDPYTGIRPKRTTPEQQATLELLQQKRRAALKMKTPMQLRWEAEAAKKKTAAPAVDTDTLLRALGEHIIKGKKEMKMKRKAAKAAEPAKAEELD